MESQYKVCEVKLTYKSKIKASEREKILSAENAYKILLSVFDSETIQYKEFFKVILMNRANKVLGVCHISEGGLNETSADIRIIMQAAILGKLLPSYWHTIIRLGTYNQVCKTIK